VIVCDLDIVGIALLPSEAQPPLIVDAYAVLPFALPSKLLEAISAWDAQVLKRLGCVQHGQLPVDNLLGVQGKPPGSLPPENPFGILVPESPDHLL
jgi:hypothetical protein